MERLYYLNVMNKIRVCNLAKKHAKGVILN